MRDDKAANLDRLQDQAVTHLRSHPRVADYSEMGTGKSKKLITAADDLGCIDRLIVCPEIARRNWEREHKRWSFGSDLPVQVVERNDEIIDPKARMVIVGHNALRHPILYQQIRARAWDVGLIDESHAFRKPDSQRSMALFGHKCHGTGLVSRMKRVILASGTPMPVAADALWPCLRALRPELILDHKDSKPLEYDPFVDLYCDKVPGAYGPVIRGSRNLSDLKHRIKPFFVRQRLVDLVEGMPPIHVYHQTLTANERTAKMVRELEERPEFAALSAVLAAVSRGEYGDVDSWMADEDETNPRKKTPLSTLLRLTGVLKARAVIEQILPELGDGAYEKLVLFAVHHDTMDVLEEALQTIGVVRVDGKTSPAAQQEAIDRFQNDAHPRVFLAQLHKCNSAITLTRAWHVALAEFSFIPALIYQAFKRVHRIGQAHPVNARIFGLENSIDGKVAAIVERRTRDIAAVFGE
jgi:hypothetical protein